MFHYEQVAESDAGVIEITYAKPAKEDKPQAQYDFRRLLLERAREGNRLRGENVNFCWIYSCPLLKRCPSRNLLQHKVNEIVTGKEPLAVLRLTGVLQMIIFLVYFFNLASISFN